MCIQYNTELLYAVHSHHRELTADVLFPINLQCRKVLSFHGNTEAFPAVPTGQNSFSVPKHQNFQLVWVVCRRDTAQYYLSTEDEANRHDTLYGRSTKGEELYRLEAQKHLHIHGIPIH
jgi:hypothetical protein